jgi:hypothetical protein
VIIDIILFKKLKKKLCKVKMTENDENLHPPCPPQGFICTVLDFNGEEFNSENFAKNFAVPFYQGYFEAKNKNYGYYFRINYTVFQNKNDWNLTYPIQEYFLKGIIERSKKIRENQEKYYNFYESPKFKPKGRHNAVEMLEPMFKKAISESKGIIIYLDKDTIQDLVLFYRIPPPPASKNEEPNEISDSQTPSNPSKIDSKPASDSTATISKGGGFPTWAIILIIVIVLLVILGLIGFIGFMMMRRR